MFWTRHHLSDQELLMAADNELSARRLERAHKHLGDCSTCQMRMDVIARTLADVSRLCRERPHPPVSPAGSARARLEIQLTRLSKQHETSSVSAHLQRHAVQRRWLHAVVILVLSASGLFLYGRSAQVTSTETSDAPRVFLLPMADLTPGATRLVTLSDLCSGTKHGPTAMIPASVHQEVFRRYGADSRRAAEYELDHLITPELGGASDARNLWPQAYSHTPWNAYVKDELERLFHRLVCDGDIELVTAQQEIAKDWISAYKHYFRTDKPLRDYDTAPLTALDRDLLLSELEEFGVSPLPSAAEGRVLMVMLQSVREGSFRGRLAGAPQEDRVVVRASATLAGIDTLQ